MYFYVEEALSFVNYSGAAPVRFMDGADFLHMSRCLEVKMVDIMGCLPNKWKNISIKIHPECLFS